MATRKDDSRGLRPYQAHRREEWLHDLKLELRTKSRFAFELIMEEHQPPHGVTSAEDAAALMLRYLPAAQSVHTPSPRTSLKEPGEQGSQRPDDARNVPAAHLHASEPAIGCDSPKAHDSHDRDSGSEALAVVRYLPASHLMQCSRPRLS